MKKILILLLFNASIVSAQTIEVDADTHLYSTPFYTWNENGFPSPQKVLNLKKYDQITAIGFYLIGDDKNYVGDMKVKVGDKEGWVSSICFNSEKLRKIPLIHKGDDLLKPNSNEIKQVIVQPLQSIQPIQSKTIILENIYYSINSIAFNEASQKKLDMIVTSMEENKSLKLVIASYTDSKGDDTYNMKLSEIRAQKIMEYIITKGIAKERIFSKGYGETQILNRCKNGVNCSEMESKLNRRTELNFTK